MKYTVQNLCGPQHFLTTIIGLLSYMYKKNMSLSDVYDLLNNYNIKFDGIDGGFYFKDNVIERNLDIVQISKGKTLKIN